jgi:uncharacterized membrane protein YoaK (UPF0700 family)
LKFWLPVLLSLNAGYVDTAGFVALHGLFTAHVTGNFVTFGAALALGSAGALPKLLALPVFCAVVILARLFGEYMRSRGLPALQTLLVIKVLLLAAAAALAIRLGPFGEADDVPVILTGMTLVSAMAIQNAVHRTHLASAPPTTLMTGTTTQIMLDLADLLYGVQPEAAAVARTRLAKMSVSVAAFALGCAAGAVLYTLLGDRCFLIPPALGAISPFLATSKPATERP